MVDNEYRRWFGFTAFGEECSLDVARLCSGIEDLSPARWRVDAARPRVGINLVLGDGRWERGLQWSIMQRYALEHRQSLQSIAETSGVALLRAKFVMVIRPLNHDEVVSARVPIPFVRLMGEIGAEIATEVVAHSPSA